MFFKSFRPIIRDITYYGIEDNPLHTYSDMSSLNKWGRFGLWNQSSGMPFLIGSNPILFCSKPPRTRRAAYYISTVPLKWIDIRVLA